MPKFMGFIPDDCLVSNLFNSLKLNLEKFSVSELTLRGDLRFVNLNPLLTVKNLKRLNLRNCFITHNNLRNFLLSLGCAETTKLNYIDLSKNPIGYTDFYSSGFKAVYKENFIETLTKVRELCLRGIVFNLEECVNYVPSHDLEGLITETSTWQLLQKLLAKKQQQNISAQIATAFKQFFELNEVNNHLLSHPIKENAAWQRMVEEAQKKLAEACASFEKLVNELNDDVFDGHLLVGRYYELSGYPTEAYSKYAEIPRKHPDFSQAQHAMMMLIGEAKVLPQIVFTVNHIEFTAVSIAEMDAEFQKLIAMFVHADATSTLQNQDAKAIQTIMDFQLQKFISDEGMQTFTRRSPANIIGLNINTFCQLIVELKATHQELKQTKQILKTLTRRTGQSRRFFSSEVAVNNSPHSKDTAANNTPHRQLRSASI